MKDLTFLFSSFEGRVSRRAFWSAATWMIVAQMLLGAALARTIGLGWQDFAHADRRATWITLVVVAFFFWPSLALCVKRAHDRDLPGWWPALLHVLVFVFYADQVGMRAIIRDKATLFVAMLPAMLVFAVGSWMLIELVMLGGTPGHNRYGASPEGPQGAVGTATPRVHPGE